MTAEEVAAPSFDTIFAQYYRAIYTYILRMTGNVEQAEDLTQDTFVKAYKALPTTRELALPGWLYRIATNTVFDALRRKRRLAWFPFAPGEAERIPTPGKDLSARVAEHDAVQQALAGLSPRQRACLLLRARDGLSIEEIAGITGLSKANVKVTLYRAKERFRARYTDSNPEI